MLSFQTGTYSYELGHTDVSSELSLVSGHHTRPILSQVNGYMVIAVKMSKNGKP